VKVTCPTCREVVSAENIALDAGWAKCTRCNEVFRLSEILPGYTSGAPSEPVPERPFDARAVVERTEEKLIVHVPPNGMRPVWGLLGFAVFWLGFIAFWTAGVLGLAFGGGGPIGWGQVGFACFSIPFWAVGFVMLGTVVWSARGNRTACLTASWMLTELRCVFWRRRRRIARFLVQRARKGTFRGWRWEGRSDDTAVGGAAFPVALVFENGTFSLPCTTEAEQEWLVAEVNQFLQSVSYKPPTLLDEHVHEPRLRRD
jgi:hypothetical protein